MASKEKICGVYKITNPIGQIYIGKSNDIYGRWGGYRTMGFKSQKILYESFLKYGVKNHIFEIIEQCDPNIAVNREKYWVQYFNAYEIGLNRNKGGGGCVNHTEETKKKIGQHSLGNKYLLGKKFSSERIEQMRQYKMSQETKDKIYPKIRGQKRTEEQRKRMSESMKGRIHSPEHIEKIRKTLTETKHSPETILKRVLANSGVKACMYGKFGKDHPAFGSKRTKEQSLKQSEGLKKAWEKKREAGSVNIPEERKEKLRNYYANMNVEQKEIRSLKLRNGWIKRKQKN